MDVITLKVKSIPYIQSRSFKHFTMANFQIIKLGTNFIRLVDLDGILYGDDGI
jgi:hypothetical protein